MPVFYSSEESVLYIHVPKTGGSSVEAMFLSSGYASYFLHTRFSPMTKAMKCSPQHYNRDMLEECFILDGFDLVFMTVRHPVSRMVSEFNMRRGEADVFEDWVEKTLLSYEDNPFIFDNHIRPQVDFFVDRALVFRQEDGFDDRWVSSINCFLKEKLTGGNVHRLKSNFNRFDVSKSVREEIESFYEEDMRAFGY